MPNVIPFKGRTFYKPMPDGNWTIDTEELGRIIADKTGFDYEAVMAVLTVDMDVDCPGCSSANCEACAREVLESSQ